MVEAAERIWQAAGARDSFAEVMDGAIAGVPQAVRHEDGREVVVVSRDHYERTRPSLKAYLLANGYAGEEEDAFDRAMRDVRNVPALHGAMRGSVHMSPDVDLTETADETWEA